MSASPVPFPNIADEPIRRNFEDVSTQLGGILQQLEAINTADPIACRVYNSANLTIPTGLVTALTFDLDRWDDTDMHSTSVNTGRITFATPGWYVVTGNAQWDVVAGGERSASIRLNGATEIARTRSNPGATTTAANENPATIYKFAAGDYVEMTAFQTSGVPVNLLVTGDYTVEFAVALVQGTIVSGSGGGAPTGAAGGVLGGTYPNPSFAAGAIVNADVNAAAGIAATKIGGGAVSDTEFSYLDGVTSAIQTQLNAKAGTAVANTFTLAQLFPAGTAALPGVAVGTAGYGMYQSGVLTGLSSNGASRLTVDSTRTTVGVLGTGNGSLANCGHSFPTDPDNGMNRVTTNTLGLVAGATLVQRMTATLVEMQVMTAFPFGPVAWGELGCTSTYAILTTDPSFLPIDTSGGAGTITLPDPAGFPTGQGLEYVLVDQTGNGAANNITFDTDGTATIRGAATYVGITTNYGAVRFRYVELLDDWVVV